MGQAAAAGDFNGDGYDDLVMGGPNWSSDLNPGPGAVYMLYGGSGDWSLIECLTPGDLGSITVEDGARFGSALAVGDFDDDGYDDLAIGLPLRTVNSRSFAGQVIVLYGSPQNLDLQNPQPLTQVPLPGTPEQGDQFGFSLAAGDLSADGVDDLAIGVPFEGVQGKFGEQENAGAVNVLYGVLNQGLTTSGSQLIQQDSPGVGLNANEDEYFGYSLAIGQLTGNSFTDLAVGTPREIVFGPGAKGAVIIFPGAVGGLDPVAGTEAVWSQESPGILGTAQVGDEFGSALAVGNFDGDLWPDLAIGVPGESELGASQSGAVQILYSNAVGLTDGGNQFIVESTFDPDVDPFDRLGTALAAGDFNADGVDDLAIGAPFDDSLGPMDTGEVDVLYGTSTGLTITGGQVFNMIFFGTLEVADFFGAALATGHFFNQNQSSDDLAIGIPGRDGPGGSADGAAVVLRSQSLFMDGFDSGNTNRWDVTLTGL